MNNVIDVTFRKDPHLSGQAVCFQCKHEWTAVCPVGVSSFECPECGCMKGIMRNIVVPDTAWVCNCGCCYYCIIPDGGAMCINCGVVQTF